MVLGDIRWVDRSSTLARHSEVKFWSTFRAEADVCRDAHGTIDPGPPTNCILP